MNSDKIISLHEYNIIKDIKEQTGLTEENSTIAEAINIAFANAKMITDLFVAIAGDRARSGLEPNPCFNAVCLQHRDTKDRPNYCNEEFECHGCTFQMMGYPPSFIDYNDEMPTHQEALDILEANNLLNGPMRETIDAASKYRTNRATSQRLRWQTEVKDITYEQLQECFKNAFMSIIENDFVELSVRDVLDNWGERVVMSAMLEVEKAMGIYPNLQLK